MLEQLTQQGVTARLELVLVDRGVTAAAARTLGQEHGVEARRFAAVALGLAATPFKTVRTPTEGPPSSRDGGLPSSAGQATGVATRDTPVSAPTHRLPTNPGPV